MRLLAVLLLVTAAFRDAHGGQLLTLIGGPGRTHSPTPIPSAEPSEHAEPKPSMTPFPSRKPQPSRRVVASAYKETNYRFQYDMHHTRSGFSTFTMALIFIAGAGAGVLYVRRQRDQADAQDTEPLAASSYTSLMPPSYDDD